MNHEQQTGARSIGDENLPAARQLDGERVNEPRRNDNRVIIAASAAAGTVGLVGMALAIDAATKASNAAAKASEAAETASGADVKASDAAGTASDAAAEASDAVVKASEAADTASGAYVKASDAVDTASQADETATSADTATQASDAAAKASQDDRELRAIQSFKGFLRRVISNEEKFIDDFYHYISEDMFTDKGFDMLAKLDEANLWALNAWMDSTNADDAHIPIQALLEKLSCSEKGLNNLAAWMSKSEDNILPWLGENFYHEESGADDSYSEISLCMDYNNSLNYDIMYDDDPLASNAYKYHYTSGSLLSFLMKFYRTEDGTVRDGAPDLMKRVLGSKGLNILSREERVNCDGGGREVDGVILGEDDGVFKYNERDMRYYDWDNEALCDMITFDKTDGELTTDVFLNGETQVPDGADNGYVLARGFLAFERTAALHNIWISLQKGEKDKTKHYVDIKKQFRHLVTEDSTGIRDPTARGKIIDKLQGIITSAWEARVKDMRDQNRGNITAEENLTSNGTNITKAYLQSVLSVYYDHEELGISKGQALDVVKSLFGATEHDEVSLFGDRTDGEVLERLKDCKDLFLDEDVFLHKVTTTADDGTKKEVTKHVCHYLLPNGAPKSETYPWTIYDNLEVQEDYGLDGAGDFNWEDMLAGIKSIAESNDWMPNA